MDSRIRGNDERPLFAGMTTPDMITVTINGQRRDFAQPLAFDELVRELGLAGKRIAVERNGEIVPRSQFARAAVADGDKLEIVVAVGGG